MGDLRRLLRKSVQPDYEGLRACLRRQGTPPRVFALELLIDREVKERVAQVFDVATDLQPSDPHYAEKREIAVQRFLGYEVVSCSADWPGFPRGVVGLHEVRQNNIAGRALVVEDVTGEEGQSRGTRVFMDEHSGPIQSWEDYERYRWPNPSDIRVDSLDWLARHLPDDMGLMTAGFHFFEYTSWFLGYERLCLAIYDQPDLVAAIIDRVGTMFYELAKVLVTVPRLGIIFAADDMGFKTQTMVHPKFLVEKILPWHRKLAALAHAHDQLYLLHSCGNIGEIMEPLVQDVGLDGKHSFEDAIQPVEEAKRLYGERLALIGGLDVDLLSRGSEEQIRRRVRGVLDECLTGGGYCLGSGNSIANYIPLRNYLIMLDEGRCYP